MFDEELSGAGQFEHLSMRSEFKAMQILNAAGSVFHIHPEEIRSKAPGKKAVHARWTAIYLIREDLKPSLPWIGRFIGGRHHTTVMHALEKTRDAVRRRSPLAEKIRIARAMYPNMPGDRFVAVGHPNVPLPVILNAVATMLDLEPAEIYRESNAKRIVFPRQMVNYLLREIGGWSNAEIADHFSQDKTTALYGYLKIKAKMKDDHLIRYLIHEAQSRCFAEQSGH